MEIIYTATAKGKMYKKWPLIKVIYLQKKMLAKKHKTSEHFFLLCSTLDFLSDTLARMFYKGRIQSIEPLLLFAASLQKVMTYSTSICRNTVAD